MFNQLQEDLTYTLKSATEVMAELDSVPAANQSGHTSKLSIMISLRKINKEARDVLDILAKDAITLAEGGDTNVEVVKEDS